MRGYPRNRLTDRSGAGPVITKTTSSRGYTINFEEAGRGPAIVLIPGATMSAGDGVINVDVDSASMVN